MKKSLLVAFAFVTTFAFAGNTEVETVLVKEEVKTEEQVKEVTLEETFDKVDATNCKITKGDMTVECTNCDCAKLVKAMK